MDRVVVGTLSQNHPGINTTYGFCPHREKEAMNDQTGKLPVVEPDDALRATLITVLGDAGYKVSTDYREGMRDLQERLGILALLHHLDSASYRFY
jgi:hypothetical protein